MPEFTAPLFSTKLALGRRTYFFDVRKTKDDKPYIKITEYTVKDGQKEKVNILVFDNEVEQFRAAINQVFDFLSNK